MTKIVISTSSFDQVALEELSDHAFTVVLNPYGRRLTEAEISSFLKENNPIGLIAGVEPLTERVLTATPSLKIISRCGVGLDNVDLNAARRLGIQVYNTPDAPVQAVAELTLALMLNILRKVHQADQQIRMKRWQPLMGELLANKTVGIIGLGRIGKRVKELLGVFGARIISYDPNVKNDMQVALDVLLHTADLVTLHLPYAPETHHFINAARLAMLKPTSFIFNLSRGNLIDEGALYYALKANRIAGAGLDVFAEEPYVGRLTECDNVILTSHMGSYAKEARKHQEREAVLNLKLGLEQMTNRGG